MTKEMEILLAESGKRGLRASALYARLCASLDAVHGTPTQDLQGALALAKAAHDGPVEYAIRRELMTRQRRGESIALKASV